MDQKALLAYFEFNARANEAVLDTVALLPAEMLESPCSPSHGTIRALLGHVLEGEVYFLDSCRGVTPNTEAILTLPTLDGIRVRWNQAISDGRAFVTGLSDAETIRETTLNFGEHIFKLPLWQWFHMNWTHSIHHRGELSVILTQAGHPVPELDLAEFLIRGSGQDWPF